MKSVKLLIIGALFLGVSFSVSAEGFYFGSGVGVGDIEIEGGFLPLLTPNTEDNDGALVVDVFAAYEFSNSLFVDLSFENYGNFNFFNLGDRVNVFAARLGIGYAIPSESRFKFYGKTGINFWNVDITEGILFNPGPEESSERNGNDLFVQIGTDYRLNKRLRLDLNYSYSDTEFGEVSGAKITFKWFPWIDKGN